MRSIYLVDGRRRINIAEFLYKGRSIKSLPATSVRLIIKLILLTGIFCIFVIYFVSWFSGYSFQLHSAGKFQQQDLTAPDAALQKEVMILFSQLNAKTPRGSYLLINTTENTYRLYKGRKLSREGICSSGSFIKLEHENGQSWRFKTPHGEFKVRSKVKKPVWKKPDWAFVEEGLPVPPPNHPSRFEYGVLGDYALGIGNGYLIHGTLYQRLLGMPVTHGCIRLADEDLEIIYQALEIGSNVYIY